MNTQKQHPEKRTPRGQSAMRGGDAHAGERASLLFARADEDVEARAPLARGERASSRPSRAQCAAAAVVAILGASAVTGASRSHLASPARATPCVASRTRARGQTRRPPP